jgi:hypothetical protein
VCVVLLLYNVEELHPPPPTTHPNAFFLMFFWERKEKCTSLVVFELMVSCVAAFTDEVCLCIVKNSCFVFGQRQH